MASLAKHSRKIKNPQIGISPLDTSGVIQDLIDKIIPFIEQNINITPSRVGKSVSGGELLNDKERTLLSGFIDKMDGYSVSEHPKTLSKGSGILEI